ncbi:MAG: hypothetical protein K8T25_02800, partial [Planctomycetia bacterium]|nr:hypothetical protein [Planctomycetia bacterium]
MISRALSIAVVCGTLILLPSASSRAADPAAPLDLTWKDNILTISSPQLSGGPLDIRYLEAFVRSGSTKRDWGQSVIDHHTVWTSQSSDEIKNTLALRSTLANGVTVTHSVRSDVDEIDFQLAAINRTKEFADVQWAQPCVHIAKFAGPGPADANAVQPKYIRNCFIFVNGKEQRLPTEPWAKNARYTPGQVYCPAGVDRADVNPRPLSNVVPSCSLMGCYSADGKQIVAIAWDSYQEVFQGVVGCLHSDLRIGGLKPGERKKIHGKLYVVSADMDQLKRRFARDFPSQAAGVGIAAEAAPSIGGPVDAKGRPRIEKLGTIATHMVETTPVVFQGRLYRFEWVRENDPKKPIRDPNNKLGYDHFHFIDVATGKATEPFAIGYRFGSAFVDGDTVYVTGSGREEGWSGRHVQVFASKDLKNWQSWEAIPPPKYGICNTSVCKADGKYVLMFEIWKPVEEAGVKYTARFA